MKLEEIKKAVNEGKKVCWVTELYEVQKSGERYLTVCTSNDHVIGLETVVNGVGTGELIGDEKQYFIPEECPILDYDELPQEAKNILSTFDDEAENMYHECDRLKNELFEMSILCDFDLGAGLFDFRYTGKPKPKTKNQKFILGYDNCDSEELTVYKTTDEAIFNSEEWCTVEAETLEEAKAKYEEAFHQWQNEIQILNEKRENENEISSLQKSIEKAESEIKKLEEFKQLEDFQFDHKISICGMKLGVVPHPAVIQFIDSLIEDKKDEIENYNGDIELIKNRIPKTKGKEHE